MTKSDLENRLQECFADYGPRSVHYYVGAIDGAFQQADRIADALGVDRINLHFRLKQLGAFVWQMKMEGKTEPADAADEIERLRKINTDLLTALREIANRAVPVQKEEHRMARAAIAKAKGETE